MLPYSLCYIFSILHSPDKSISRPARKQPISSTPLSPIKLAKRKAEGDAATKTPKKPKLSDGLKAREISGYGQF